MGPLSGIQIQLWEAAYVSIRLGVSTAEISCRHGALLDKGERHPKRQAGAIACCITYRQCLAAACHAKVGKIRSLPEAGRRKAADADGEKRQVESWNASAKRRALQR